MRHRPPSTRKHAPADMRVDTPGDTRKAWLPEPKKAMRKDSLKDAKKVWRQGYRRDKNKLAGRPRKFRH